MVKKFTKEDEGAIGTLLQELGAKCAVKLSLVVVSTTGQNKDFVLIYGLILGSLLSLALWLTTPFPFPALLAFQLAVVVLVDLVTPFRHFAIRLIPKILKFRRAGERAFREYLITHAETQRDEPFVILFVAVAERYVHIFASPAVQSVIPADWASVTNQFVATMKADTLGKACVQSLTRIGDILSPHFPKSQA